MKSWIALAALGIAFPACGDDADMLLAEASGSRPASCGTTRVSCRHPECTEGEVVDPQNLSCAAAVWQHSEPGFTRLTFERGGGLQADGYLVWLDGNGGAVSVLCHSDDSVTRCDPAVRGRLSPPDVDACSALEEPFTRAHCLAALVEFTEPLASSDWPS